MTFLKNHRNIRVFFYENLLKYFTDMLEKPGWLFEPNIPCEFFKEQGRMAGGRRVHRSSLTAFVAGTPLKHRRFYVKPTTG